MRANEYLVSQLDAAVHRNIVLDLDPVANPNRLVHEDVLSESAVGTDARAGTNVRVMPDMGARSYGGTGLDYGRFVDEGVIARYLRHLGLPKVLRSDDERLLVFDTDRIIEGERNELPIRGGGCAGVRTRRPFDLVGLPSSLMAI
jgi:hypothetical protein